MAVYSLGAEASELSTFLCPRVHRSTGANEPVSADFEPVSGSRKRKLKKREQRLATKNGPTRHPVVRPFADRDLASGANSRLPRSRPTMVPVLEKDAIIPGRRVNALRGDEQRTRGLHKSGNTRQRFRSPLRVRRTV